jgi:asparagine synthase (glutamine-hydrolysing)
MSQSIWGTPRWRDRVVSLSDGALGWCGWKAPSIAEAEGVACTMDGVPLGSEAASFMALFLSVGFEEAVRRTNGDFAIALYDGRDGTLWLARDRFGVKPLYYARLGESVAFASRPRALWEVSGVTRRPDPKVVALYAASHYRVFDHDPNRSPYAGISQLPAGHVARFNHGRWTQIRYWGLADAPNFEEDESVLADRYRELFMRAVERRVHAAEKPAFMLSGGLDSSSVVSTVNSTGS